MQEDSAPEECPPESERVPPVVRETRCCIVGGGPGGAMLALLLARQGIPVVLLESHSDFERDFRGDTLHASVLELLDAIGLSERLLQLRHAKVRGLSLPTSAGSASVELFGSLSTKFPYITVMASPSFSPSSPTRPAATRASSS